MSKVIVVGGGAAGMLAAARAAERGHEVTLLEQNEKLGKKLYITGKGRCNFTNMGGRENFFAHVVKNPRFLYSAYNACNEDDITAILNRMGVETKVERGARAYPQSDKASDVLRALIRYMEQQGVKVLLHTAVKEILVQNGAVCGVQTASGARMADAVIIATGGMSYPSTGSRGDGHRFAQNCGHSIVPCRPSLVALHTEESWPATLSGLTLKNVTLRAFEENKLVYAELGEMLFSHVGVTGPLVLSASAYLQEAAGARLTIDLKPGLSSEQLDKRLLRDLEAGRRMAVKNALSGLLPIRLLPVVLNEAGIAGEISASELTRAQRTQLTETLKALPLTVAGMGTMEEAVVTRGGVSTKEINPSTMESRLVRGLYFAGELIDVDALTGGYNLQIAWSTGYLAGSSC